MWNEYRRHKHRACSRMAAVGNLYYRVNSILGYVCKGRSLLDVFIRYNFFTSMMVLFAALAIFSAFDEKLKYWAFPACQPCSHAQSQHRVSCRHQRHFFAGVRIVDNLDHIIVFFDRRSHERFCHHEGQTHSAGQESQAHGII